MRRIAIALLLLLQGCVSVRPYTRYHYAAPIDTHEAALIKSKCEEKKEWYDDGGYWIANFSCFEKVVPNTLTTAPVSGRFCSSNFIDQPYLIEGALDCVRFADSKIVAFKDVRVKVLSDGPYDQCAMIEAQAFRKN